MVSYSGVGKIRRHPLQVRAIHETVGVPLKYFPLLATCELGGALGLVVGIREALIGIAAGIGLVLYFVGALASHLRVGDFVMSDIALPRYSFNRFRQVSQNRLH